MEKCHNCENITIMMFADWQPKNENNVYNQIRYWGVNMQSGASSWFWGSRQSNGGVSAINNLNTRVNFRDMCHFVILYADGLKASVPQGI